MKNRMTEGRALAGMRQGELSWPSLDATLHRG